MDRFRLGLVAILALALTSTFGPLAGPTAGAPVDELVVAEAVTQETLDGQRTTVQTTLNVTFLINEPLLWLDFSDREIKPQLATSYRLVTNTIWEFKIREGVKFTNGEEMDAAAVKFSLDRIRRPDLRTPLAIYARSFREIQVVDKYTVRVMTPIPAPVLPLYMTRIGIVPPRYLQERGDEEFGRTPIGTGPYKLDRWVRGERVVLSANESYWGGRPSAPRLVWRYIPENATRVAALGSGEVHIAATLPYRDVAGMRSRGLNVIPVNTLRTMFVQFNLLKDRPLRNKKVRQALNYAVDKDVLISTVLDGYARKLDGQVLTRDYFGYHEGLKAYPYDPNKAKQLLTEAGFASGLTLNMTGPPERYVLGKETMQVVAAMLERVGVRVTQNYVEFGRFVQMLLSREYDDMAFWGAATVPDADVYLGAVFLRGGAYSALASEEFDDAYNRAQRTMDLARRLELYKKAAEVLHEEVPAIFLHQQVNVFGLSPRVTGFRPDPDEGIRVQGVRFR
ncbi:MAG: ABC transporter substrate-binding protein [Armatimonadota bacterium]